ncbi:MAG: DUF3048 domain-containing protein [Eubacteriales bacterium]|nr:DUF3048 domain-containing protein [Eubacteriales bacterium]
MKNRRAAALGAALLAGILLAGADFASEVYAEQLDMIPVQQETAVQPQEEMVTSYLTGEQIAASKGRRRPISVMLSNIQEGCPQSGIAKAGVIYEAPVEGNITRLMAIFEDYDDLTKIGSVRSCRDYYLFYSQEFDAVYAHYGQAVYALNYLDQGLVDNLNGLSSVGSAVYYRTTDRQAPHNAYTSAEGLSAGIAAEGYRQGYSEDYQGHYLFAENGQETIPQGGIAANEVHLNCFPLNQPWFSYDASTGEYKRFQYGQAQVDDLTGEQLTCDNIILQYSQYTNYDENGYLNIDAISGGQGKFITRGQAIDIRWEKDSVWGVTHYFDSSNQEIRLNPGKTWVEIVLNDRVDQVTYQ